MLTRDLTILVLATDMLTRHVIALQQEAAHQAEENWESLSEAEKRIFDNIAKGRSQPKSLSSSLFTHG